MNATTNLCRRRIRSLRQAHAARGISGRQGIERLFRKGESQGVQAQHAARITRLLDLLDDASSPEQLNIPGLYLHPLKGSRKGEWAISVSGNWRMTFHFEGEDVTDVNLEDYH